jgi:beta-lactamase regulating signal transducer with metallopeptidase domain
VDTLLQVGLSNAVAAAALALLAVLVGAVCRRPALAHGLWLLVLLKLLTPPLVRVPVPWPTPAAPEAARLEVTSEPGPDGPAEAPSPAPAERPAEVQAAAPAAPAAEAPAEAAALPAEAVDVLPAADGHAAAPADWSWSEAVAAGWLLGSLAWFALAGLRLARFARLLRHATPAPPEVQERARRLARRLGLARCPGVWLLPGRVAPMLWAAFGRPRLLVPAGLLGRLTPEGRDTLLLHELAHLRRGDHRVRALEFLAMGLYWWHPVVWFARRELREAEEQCCDAWVVATLPGAGRAYASALLDTLDFLSAAPPAVPLLASGLGQVSDLKRRLTMIMRGTTPRALGWRGALTVLVLGALLLPVLPTRAQERPAREADREETVKRVQISRDDSSPELQKAEAELQRLQAEIERKKAEIATRKARLKAEAARAKAAELARSRAAEALGRVQVRQLRQVGQRQTGPQIRIEIIVAGDEKAEAVQELIKKLEKALPEGSRRVINLRMGGTSTSSSTGGSSRTTTSGRPVPPMPRRPGAAAEPPRPPAPPTPAPPGAGGGFRALPGMMPPGAPGGRGNDPRIEGLERKLEAIMRELESLRRDLNRQRRGGGSGSGGGAGAGSSAPALPGLAGLPPAGVPVLPPGALPPVKLPPAGVPVTPPPGR